ncbi:hypothetical protein KFE98_04565 [bacterium SCSIO 12741]|nr:hypothetical protein KFE98_04565 [bacterium SCSIO 12741]
MIFRSVLAAVLVVILQGVAVSQEIIWSKEAHPDGLQTNGVQFDSDGDRVLTVTNCHPAKIRLFSAQDGNLIWDYEVSTNLLCIMGGGIASNGKNIAVIEEFGNLILFDLTTNPPDSINAFHVGTPYAFCMDFSPSGSHVAVGGSKGKMIICSVDSAKVLHSVKGHLDWVTAVRYDPNGQFIVSGGNDGMVKVWDTLGAPLAQLPGHVDEVTDLAISKDGKTLISSSRDKTIKVWDVPNKKLLKSIDNIGAATNGVSFSPDQKHLAVVSADSLLQIYSTNSWELEATTKDEINGFGLCVHWAPVGKRIAVGTNIGMVAAYSMETLGSGSFFLEQTSFNVYPNPLVDKLYIESFIEGMEYIITNLQGVEISKGYLDSSKNELDFPSDQPGYYLLKILDPSTNRVQVYPIVKSK